MGDKLVGPECFMASKVEAESSAIKHNLNQEAITIKNFPLQGDFELFSINSTHPEHKIKIDTTFPPPILQEVQDILFEYKDIFSWIPHDLGTISRNIAEYRLGIPPNFPSSPIGAEFAYALKYSFPISNNESEALLAGLRMALAINMEQLIIHGDSKFVYNHIIGTFEAKEDNMKKYSMLAKTLVSRFKRTWIKKVRRRNNQKAYELSTAISGKHISGIWLEPFIKKSIDKEILCMNPEDNWMTSIKNYILNGSLLYAVDQAQKIKTTAEKHRQCYKVIKLRGGIHNFKTPVTQPSLSILGNQVTVSFLEEQSSSMEEKMKYARMRKWRIQVIGHHHWFSYGDPGEVHPEFRRIKQLQGSIHCTQAYS
ncbi:hypothetical protein M9H77_04102 [Catharanthus roseus]|uniref:Uncharacterized protein n=1 Tax=Catharanthus roseus TaxID=4058 RepID=A0ACC0CDK9_CATRO|nr:hypothetical protein M9H77_04102 [Catharanthus roseus]